MAVHIVTGKINKKNIEKIRYKVNNKHYAYILDELHTEYYMYSDAMKTHENLVEIATIM